MMVDIILINYNSTIQLLQCLVSIYRHIDDDVKAIYIIDNNSSDAAVQLLTDLPKVNLTVLPRNIGFASAVNIGIKKSSSPYTMLLNPDTSFNMDIIGPMVAYLNDHERVGIIGPKILNYDGSIQGSARSFPSFFTGLFGRTSLFSRIFPKNRMTKKNIITMPDTIETTFVDWVSGACMLIRRKAIEEVGGLDERFFMYWEDADWCKRMWKKRWGVVYYQKASIYHSVGQSSRSKPIRPIWEFHKSAYRLYEKYARGMEVILQPFVFLALAMRFYLLAFKGILDFNYRKLSVISKCEEWRRSEK